ncbi:hypothetical protein GM658_11225 [Pseudoduganella eburnea]|uniref:Uncharacterized protein n=1 Tax=Massilia eburnea TaxID=1776165 RepID=A0A6L6QGB4_9BURK|nr:hypothetical protein [Massilia eburnea]MTW11171.1 hypothetical protein [Massilia eburnea]
MILLPDEDEEPVRAQVNAVIAESLRQSVAGAELSPGFQSRLSAALDALERDGLPASQGPAAATAGAQAAEGGAAAGPGAPGLGAEAAEAAS